MPEDGFRRVRKEEEGKREVLEGEMPFIVPHLGKEGKKRSRWVMEGDRGSCLMATKRMAFEEYAGRVRMLYRRLPMKTVARTSCYGGGSKVKDAPGHSQRSLKTREKP